jgi:uncharacterized membrane protein YhhN
VGRPVIVALGLLLAASGAATIAADYGGRRAVVYVCKPLTIVFAMAIAATAGDGPSPPYRALILGGLACSLVGDVLLMLPVKRFAAGLASFLVAHVCYVAAFAGASPARAPLVLLAAAAAIGAAVTVPLWPHLGRYRLAVAVYVGALVALLWQSAGWAAGTGAPHARLAALGAVLFTVSDAVLAHNRFRRPFRAAQGVILSTYFIAQGLIAASARSWG